MRQELTDEEENEEDDVDDEFSERCLDLDVALGAVLCETSSPQRCNEHTHTHTHTHTHDQ